MTIRSRIDGEFNGTGDELVYKLRNGQVWQQVGYRYRYRYSPAVTINTSGSRGVMIVDGFDDPIKCAGSREGLVNVGTSLFRATSFRGTSAASPSTALSLLLATGRSCFAQLLSTRVDLVLVTPA